MSNTFNKLILVGNLTKDPETKFVGDTQFTTLNIATTEGWGDNERANFHQVIIVGKGAKFANDFLSKGTKVLIEGFMESGSYEKDGKKVYTYRPKAFNVTKLSSNSLEKAADNNKDDDDLPW